MIQNVIQCSAQHMTKGGIARDGMRAPDELFKMPVIELELVIKIQDRENRKTRSICPGGDSTGE